VTGERAAQLPRQSVESRMRLAAGEHAYESGSASLNAGNAVDQPGDEGRGVSLGGAGVELLVRKLQDTVLKLLDQGGYDIVLAFEELIDRADRPSYPTSPSSAPAALRMFATRTRLRACSGALRRPFCLSIASFAIGFKPCAIDNMNTSSYST
jgi:hypothetical protein